MAAAELVKDAILKEKSLVADDEKVLKKDSQQDSKSDGAKQLKDGSQPMHVGWRGTLCWSGYDLLQLVGE